MTARTITNGASFTIPEDHPSLAGHFPGNPVVPGSVVLDHILAEAEAAGFGPVHKLISVKFRTHLFPGQTCDVSFETGRRGVTATCSREEETVVTCLFPAKAL